MSTPAPALPVLPSRFEVVRELGAGGFGRVYLAHDRLHGERVALKVLARRDPHALKRFKTEFRSLANLVHQNLVSLFELHQPEDGAAGTAGWFFTMEHVDGRPFTDFLRPDVVRAQAYPSLTLSQHASVPLSQAPRHIAKLASPAGPGVAPPALEETEDPKDLDFAPGERAQAGATSSSRKARAPAGADLTPEAVLQAAHASATPATPLTPVAFFGIEAPDPETAERWASLRPEPGSGESFAAGEADAQARLARLDDCFAQLVDALSWLHASGHLHRDVKPSNVLVDGEGRVKLLDFGLIARLHSNAGPGETRGEPLVGTPAFMAPELCAGLPASPASDWYSMGVMLYLVLTGRLPFSGDAQTVVLAKQAIVPRRPSELNAVPEALDTLTMALLSVNPLDRPDAAALSLAFGAQRDLDLLSRPTLRGETDVFVGRRAEVATLAQALGPSETAGARVALVSGPSGYGKSALVRHVLRELGRSVEPPYIILHSRCFERGTVRYRALDGAVDDLAGVLGAMSLSEREALIPAGLDRVALARLFPVLALVGTPGGDPTREPHSETVADPTDLRRRALLALRELFAAISRARHLIFAVDDAQWADEDSVPLVADLIRQTQARWVFTFRPEEGAPGGGPRASQQGVGSHLIAALTRDILPRLDPSAVTQITLERLPQAEAEALARESLEDWRVAVDDNEARQLAEEAGGHPLLIAELARASVLSLRKRSDDAGVSEHQAPTTSATPASLDGLLAARVLELPSRCRAAMELVALAGEPVSPRLLRLAAGADTADLQRLERDHLIVTRPGGDGELAMCWHDRVRESTLSLIAEADRPRLHLALARSGERAGLADPFFLGSHYGRAVDGWLDGSARAGLASAAVIEIIGPFRRALEWGWKAIEQARAALAFDQAARVAESLITLCARAGGANSGITAAALEEALSVCGGLARLTLTLAESLANAGRGVRSAQAFERVATLASGEVERRRHELQAAEQYLFAGAFGEGEATIRRVLGRAQLKVAQGVPGAMLSFLWETLRMRLRGMRFEAVEEGRVAPAELALVDTLWSATIGLSMAWPLGSQAFQQRHLRMALNAGEPRRVARALSIELAFSGLPGVKASARSARLSTLAHEVAKRDPHPYAEAFATMSDGGVHWLNGRWRAAKDAAEQALVVYRRDCVGVAWEKDTAEFVALSALAHMGELDALQRRVDEVLADAIERGDLYLETQILTRFAPLLELRRGRPEAARATIDRALARWKGAGFQVVHYWGLVNRVNAWLYEGDAAKAQAEITANEGQVRRSFLLMGQYYRVQWHELLAKVGVALLARGVKAGRRMAMRSMKVLAKEGVPWAEALAALTRAELAGLSGRAEAADIYAISSRGFTQADMRLHALAADLARASGAGSAAPDGVLAEVRALGAEEPGALLSVFAPTTRGLPPGVTA